MLNRKTLFGTVSAVALALPFASAMAAAPVGFAGTLGGDYTYVDAGCSGCGHANAWGINGAGAFGLGMNNLGAEIDGGYRNFSGSGLSADIWNIAGSAFWAANQGRVGGTVGYESISSGGSSAHATTYGAFGEFYPSDMITIGLKGGGLSDSGASGSYIGGGITGYIQPNLALMGSIDYASESGTHLTSYTAQVQYMFATMTPIVVRAGYTGTDLGCSGCSTLNQYFVGFTVYTQGNGDTLKDKQRNGTLGSLSSTAFLGQVF